MVGIVANKFKTSPLEKKGRMPATAVLRDARLQEILA